MNKNYNFKCKYSSKYICLSPYIVAFFTLIVFLVSEANGIHYGGPGIPRSWGLLKDFLDIFIVMIFPFNGWIFLFPLIIGFIVRVNIINLIFLYFFMSFIVGCSDTFISFEQGTIERYVEGVATYLTIFGVTFAVTFIFYRFIGRKI